MWDKIFNLFKDSISLFHTRREKSNMPNFNEMNLIKVFLLLFSALVTLFLLIGAVTDINRKKPVYEQLYHIADFKYSYAAW